jgi:multidrug resistance efflux pump
MAEQKHNSQEGENQKSSAQNPKSRKAIMWVTIAILVLGGIGGGVYWYVSSQTVYIDQSVISAPIINLSPENSGVLQALFVKEGDTVVQNQPIAQVGDEIVEAQTSGEIVSVDNNIGQYMNVLTGEGTVASMIDPTQLRVVGDLPENKGLADVQVGEEAMFTVDAFGSEQFTGVVDEVSPTSRQSDVVFDISDQRPTNDFNVYVRFDPTKYPELKNGMSARIWVYKS